MAGFGAYNGVNKPIVSLPKKRSVSGFKSHTPGGQAKDGNLFLMDDTKGKESLMVRAQRDKELKVNGNYNDETVG